MYKLQVLILNNIHILYGEGEDKFVKDFIMHFFSNLSAFLRKKYFWKLKTYQFGAIFSLVSLFLYNKIFFEKLWSIYPSALFVSMLTLVLFLLLNLACALLFWKKTTKPVAILFTLLNAAVFYFMYVYHVAFDKVMLMNVLETDAQEVRGLLSFDMILMFLLLGILPSYLIIKTEIIYSGFKKEILQKLLIMLTVVLVSATIIGAGYKETAQFLRNNKPIKYLLVPANYVSAVISLSKKMLRSRPKELVKVGEDARLVPYWQNNGKKNLFVFVVGETARAANFSLNGYNRKTNAPLAPFTQDLLSYQKVYSCGTSTAISLPCIFSADNRKKFDKSESSYTENLLDVAQRAGYKVLWRGNVTGCKGICARVETQMLCNKDTCFDDILNQGLSERLQQENENMFVVLHQLGSHGPTYYKRYPKSAEIFKPNCATERLDKCSREEIVNVYDNTIYYTSQNLADLINQLKNLQDKYNVFMLYVSDHGESLGENNIYLHAAPYMVAPDEQIHVPMLVWFDENFAKTFKLDRKCLQNKLNEEYSHDNLFHSFLGLMGVQTSVYDPKLDIFAQCQQK